MTAWLEIAIPVGTAEDAEEVAARLPDEVAAAGRGTEQRDAEVVFWVPAELAEAVLTKTREVGRRLADAGLAVAADRIASRPAAPEEEWREAWKRHFRAARLTRQLVVVPSWERAAFRAEPDDLVLHLDPGQAFGTGAHASTRLVLELMQRAADEGFQVTQFLDVGAGSGILSIAAALLWPEARGVAIDNDPVAVRAAAENVGENRVAARVRCAETPLDEIGGRFDLVVANIQRDVLLSMAGALAARVARGGRLLLSGLLSDQVEEVASRFAALPELEQPATRPSDEAPEWSAAQLRGRAR